MSMSVRSSAGSSLLVTGIVVALLLVAVPAGAQVDAGVADQTGWEVEFHGGFIASTTPARGTGRLPATGTMIPFPGQPPAPAIASWYFGEGAALFNNVMDWIGRGTEIVPLDQVLTQPAISRLPGAQAGARISRRLTARLALEASVDVDTTHVALTDHAVTIVNSTSATSLEAFRWLGQYELAMVKPAEIRRSGFQLISTGTVRVNLSPGHLITPFVTIGAGARTTLGAAEATLSGSYGGTLFGNVRMEETDVVRARFRSPPTPVLVVGGGFTRATSARAGIRADVRVLVGAAGLSTHVHATPQRADFGPDGTLIRLTQPVIAFATPGSLGQSTLSVPLENFETFSAAGRAIAVSATVGYVKRF
jgi:hypothetical protein